MDRLRIIWTFISRHKYSITILAFGLIIGILDENSVIRRIRHRNEIHELNAEIRQYREEYEQSSRTLKELTSNPDELEKVAREKYFMKKSNEDIYVFESDGREDKRETESE